MSCYTFRQKQVLEVGKPEATNETCFYFHRSLIKAAALFADCRRCLRMGLVHTFFDAAQISIIDLSHTHGVAYIEAERPELPAFNA